MSLYDKQTFGASGNITLTSAEGAVTGDFCRIQCVTAVTFTTLTDDVQLAGSASVTAPTYPAGFELNGKFSAITVATGTVRVTQSAAIA